MNFRRENEIYNMINSIKQMTLCGLCAHCGSSVFEYPCNLCTDNGTSYTMFEYKKGTLAKFGRDMEKYISKNYDEDGYEIKRDK